MVHEQGGRETPSGLAVQGDSPADEPYALPVTRRLEFWPDYSGALLWDEEGSQVALESLPRHGDGDG